MKRIDAVCLVWIDAFVAWMWEVHGVSKVAMMRVSLMLAGAAMFSLYCREGFMVLGVVYVSVMVVGQTIIEYTMSMKLIVPWRHHSIFWRWPSILFVVTSLVSMIGLAVLKDIGWAVFFWLSAAHTPRTPPRSRRREPAGKFELQGV